MQNLRTYVNFFFLWVMLTILGTLAGCMILPAYLTYKTSQHNIPDPANNYQFAFIVATFLIPNMAGFFASCFQWILLRKFVRKVGFWIPTALLGWALAVVYLPMPHVFRSQPTFLLISLGGLTTGFFQWLYLRRRINHAGWWMLGSFLGWAFVPNFLFSSYTLFPDRNWIFPVLVSTIVFAVVTGVTMTLLLHNIQIVETSSQNAA